MNYVSVITDLSYNDKMIGYRFSKLKQLINTIKNDTDYFILCDSNLGLLCSEYLIKSGFHNIIVYHTGSYPSNDYNSIIKKVGGFDSNTEVRNRAKQDSFFSIFI